MAVDSSGRRSGHLNPSYGQLITGVATTEATVSDIAMTTPVHGQLDRRSLLPREHLAGSGYPSAGLIVHAARAFGITLASPLLLDTSAQARAGAGYDKGAFAIDSGARQATLPARDRQQFPGTVPEERGRGHRGVLAEKRLPVPAAAAPGHRNTARPGRARPAIRPPKNASSRE
jgi:hypothetical protein